MPDDPLDIIAASYRGIHESTQVIAQAVRLGLRLQGFALALLGLSLLGAGVLIWQHLASRQASAALNQAVLTNTQTIAAQTKALLERLDARR